MKKLLLSSVLGASLLCAIPQANALDLSPQQDVVNHYAALVLNNYKETYKDALNLQKSINQFLEAPTEKNLSEAKNAWLISRDSYGLTEAFRFYEGPIDFADAEGNEGPEGRLNAWPLDEAYIDYVQGNEKAGLVNNPGLEITKASLTNKNQADDEAEVSTGYHAIEFLLWGQDLSLDTAGTRPVSDYAKTPENDRRRQYLRVVTNLLVDDLKVLVNSWEMKEGTYASKFVKDENALSKIMTALATLSGFELASERMATALDSGDQEDEHSCFSDNTHNDFIYNAQGIYNVYFSEFNGERTMSIHGLLKEKDSKIADKIEAQLKETEALIAALPQPIDREILATPEGSEPRAQMELAIKSLQTQADLFKKAGEVLGVEVSINE